LQVQVDRKGHREPVCSMLARRASLVIAEEPFCVPWLAGVELLCGEAFEAPVWLVDCSSVVPSALVPRSACHRAYAFEQATRGLHEERVPVPWQDVPLGGCPRGVADEVLAPCVAGLPPSVDLESQDLASLVWDMEVDLSVASVSHTTPGGSAAGYSRWRSWIESGGLKAYAKRRNDSLDIHGVSRMSAYLNAGMVSPLRLAREASKASGSGKGKFLQEFLTWRGLSYAHCYHFPMPASGATLAQLPRWAQETLGQHAADPRRTIPRELLAVGRSGDAAWDGMQRYLVQTGELHNNARMGWGKAIARWAASPQDALEALLELNNRFALDGHAPPSYGGLLGCLGLFEGPKGDSAVLGKVSYKPPKSRYAAMPEMARELLATAEGKPSVLSLLSAEPAGACICEAAGSARGDSGDAAADTEPRKRRWQARLRDDAAVCIDLT